MTLIWRNARGCPSSDGDFKLGKLISHNEPLCHCVGMNMERRGSGATFHCRHHCLSMWAQKNNRKPRVFIFSMYLCMQNCHLASGKAMLPLSRCHNLHFFQKFIGISQATVKNKDSYCDHMILAQIAGWSCRKVRNGKDGLPSDLDSLQITIDPAQSMSRWKMDVQQSMSYRPFQRVGDLSRKIY